MQGAVVGADGEQAEAHHGRHRHDEKVTPSDVDTAHRRLTARRLLRGAAGTTVANASRNSDISATVDALVRHASSAHPAPRRQRRIVIDA